MFGSLGMSELVLVLVIALIVFGPRKLPQLARSIGESLAQFRRASEDFKRTWEQEVTVAESQLTAPATADLTAPPAPEPIEADPHALPAEEPVAEASGEPAEEPVPEAAGEAAKVISSEAATPSSQAG